MLSIDDRIAIHELYSRYCAYLDTCNVDAWSQLFTEDGVFDTYECARGREAITAYIQKVIAARQSKPWRNAQHWNGNLIVEGDGDTAKAMCYLIHVGTLKSSSEQVINIQGTYEDDLIKDAGIWRFKRRKVHFVTTSPDVIPKRGSDFEG